MLLKSIPYGLFRDIFFKISPLINFGVAVKKKTIYDPNYIYASSLQAIWILTIEIWQRKAGNVSKDHIK